MKRIDRVTRQAERERARIERGKIIPWRKKNPEDNPDDYIPDPRSTWLLIPKSGAGDHGA